MSPSRLRLRLPFDLETICLKCLHKEPRKRYSSARALAEDLRRFLAGEPIQARRTRTWERAIKWARRRPAVAALLAAVFLVTGAGFAGITWQWQQAVAARRQATQKAEELEIKTYFRNIALAEREISAQNVARAEELLEDSPPRFRGWEWDYLKRLRYGSPPILRHASAVYAVALSPDGSHIASGTLDGMVGICDANTGKELFTLEGQQGLIRSMVYSPDGQYLVTANQEGSVVAWDASTGRTIFNLSGDKGGLLSVVFDPAGQLLASAGADRTVALWDIKRGLRVAELAPHPDSIVGLAFSSDGRRLWSGCRDGTVHVWDADGQWLASVHDERTVMIWDANTGAKLRSFQAHSRPIVGLAFNPNSQQLASSGGADETVKIWDTRTWDVIRTLRGHLGPLCSAVFSPDGRYLACASEDSTAKVWDAKTWKEMHTLRGHTNRVYRVAFSPNSRLLASGSWDQTVKIWDVQTGQEVRILRGHVGSVGGVAFSPDGRWLASVSGYKSKGEIRIWDARMLTNQTKNSD
jgi:WD40 repeat protein